MEQSAQQIQYVAQASGPSYATIAIGVGAVAVVGFVAYRWYKGRARTDYIMKDGKPVGLEYAKKDHPLTATEQSAYAAECKSKGGVWTKMPSGGYACTIGKKVSRVDEYGRDIRSDGTLVPKGLPSQVTLSNTQSKPGLHGFGGLTIR
jgi:hypothetical protein